MLNCNVCIIIRSKLYISFFFHQVIQGIDVQKWTNKSTFFNTML